MRIWRRKIHEHQTPQGGLSPSAVVLGATVRAMKMNGGVAKNDLGDENVDAVKEGFKLWPSYRKPKIICVPVVVAINHFVKDTDTEEAVKEFIAGQGAEAIVSKHWADGSEGSKSYTRVAEIADADMANFAPLYADDMSLADKIQPL